VYWKEVRREARTRTKSGLASGYRLLTSIVLPVAGFIITCIILWKMTITIPFTLIVGVSVAISLYLLFLFGEWCTHLIRVPAQWHETQQRAILEKDYRLKQVESELQTALTPTTTGYSQAQLAKLEHLIRKGDELFQRSDISPNQSNPKGIRDIWMKQHDDWREEILALLRDRDAVIFQKPITAGSETQVLKGALDQIHGGRRGQLLEEMERLKKILERNRD